MAESAPARYDSVSMWLHWSIAGLLIVGYLIGDNVSHRNPQAIGFGIHAVIGVVLLALTLVRIGWRLGHKAPPYPITMPRWQQWAARAIKFGFYFLLLAIPLTGWAAESSKFSDLGPNGVHWFGVITVPALPLSLVTTIGEDAHEFVSTAWIFLLVLHVAAALWHHFMVRDDVLTRMLPERR